MSEFEGFGAEAQARVVEEKRLGAVRSRSREQAVEHGRRLGEDEARRRGEVGERRDERVRRAAAYAGWEWDGKPVSGSCSRQHLHHTNHAGRPCPQCGWPA